jgi:hypothetical protein
MLPGPFLRHAVVAATVALAATPAFAKRGPPPDVPPVVYEGVRYEAPPSALSNPCGQEGGCIAAYDDATGALLWSVDVYCTEYDPNRELDVQWVYITSLSIEDGKISVTNERDLHFSIDVHTHAVSGDETGCPEEPGVSQGGSGGSPAGDAPQAGEPSQFGGGSRCAVSAASRSSRGALTRIVLGLAAVTLLKRRSGRV